ncbi:MAG TPA: response regulator [Gammaproteobacteria bacterium]
MNKQLNCMLLVDDDEAHNYLNRMIIEETAAVRSIHTAWNGREAIDYLLSRGKFKENGQTYPKPEVILLDINMPVMNGWDFLEEYHKLSAIEKRKIMIVMLTTSINPDDKARAETIREISDFKNKPLTMEAVEEMVQRYFTHYI